jgi:hypothetical protein
LTAGAVAVATTVALAGLAAWPAGAQGRRLLLAVGVLAVLLQAAAVVRAAFPLATASAVVLLADYAVAVVVAPGPAARSRSPLVRVSSWRAELAAWAIDLAGTGSEPARLVWRRVGMLAAVVMGSAAFSDAVVVPAAQLGDRQGLLMRAASVAAAVAVVAILAWLSTRPNLRPARSARRLDAGSVWLGHPGGGRWGGDRS